MTQEVFDQIAILKQEHLGPHDKIMEEKLESIYKHYFEYMNNCEFIETKEFIIPAMSDKKFSNYINRTCNDSSSELIFKNLRFKNQTDAKKIAYFQLEIGGQYIDQIYPEVFKQLRKIYNEEDTRVIPFYLFIHGMIGLLYHVIRINTVTNDNITKGDIVIQYDTYKNLNHTELELKSDDSDKMPKLEIPIFLLNYDGEDSTELVPETNNTYKIRCNFNHPNYHLWSDIKYNKYQLILNGNNNITLTPDENNILNLTPSHDVDDLLQYGLNFSRVDHIKIQFRDSKKRKIKLYGIHWNMLRIICGMAGTYY